MLHTLRHNGAIGAEESSQRGKVALHDEFALTYDLADFLCFYFDEYSK